MFCTHCEKELGDAAVFCPQCGAPVKNGAKKKMPATDDRSMNEKQFTWREPTAVLAAVVLADATIYHGAGFAGLALLVCILPLLFFFGVTKPIRSWQTLLFGGLALLVSLKLIWCGNEIAFLLGLGIVFLFAALQAGVPLYWRQLRAYATNWFVAAPLNLRDYSQSLRQQKNMGWAFAPARIAAVFVPLALLGVFGVIFVCANPDLQEKIEVYWNAFVNWIGNFSDWLPAAGQMLLWVAVIWIMLGALRPRNLLTLDLFRGMWSSDSENPFGTEKNQESIPSSGQEKVLLYYAYFNSFVSLIVLFGVYLFFEFAKNWNRDFPAGFNYSQHMHQGAAYLTLALALSTIVLCTVFQGKTLLDPRIQTLRRLAMGWIILNFLLAVAVYNRLYIYIDLNGLSQRRIAGLLGTTAVVLGIIMVMRMVLLSKGLRWLVYRYTWSVLAIIFIGYVFPLAWYVSHHNVSRVMQGEIPPAIFLFPPERDAAEHYLAPLPLLDCEDETIREGARALFAQYYSSMQSGGTDWGYRWTAFQWSQRILKNRLESRKEELEPYLNNIHRRNEAIQKFRQHTNRWI